MRAKEFIIEYKEYPTREYGGVTFTMKEKDGQLIVRALNDYGISVGHVIFNMDGKILDPQDLTVASKYQGQGIARVMYDYIKSLGFTIERSWDQTPAGKGFWDKHRGEDVRIWEDELNEVNIDIDHGNDELTIKQKFLDYFSNKGYKFLGEGRDQIALLSPRDTVLKILGLGDTHRQQAVEHYVEFFERNQRNPYYPRIYNSQRFEFEGDSYFLYETEYLNYVSNEDDTLDWLERYLNHLGTDPVEAQNYIEMNGVPEDIGEDQLYGLTQSTEDIIEYLAGPKGYMMDLSNIENIRRRSDGHLVIVDPISI